MGRTLATIFTISTYGTWLRGDRRGWVDDGEVLPPSPPLEASDRSRLKHSVFLFTTEQFNDVGESIGDSLLSRLQLAIHALTVQTWHLHFVVGATSHDVAAIVKCAKDAVRWKLRLDRPIWADGYDKRFCFDEKSVVNRIHYVEKHNLRMNWPASPWSFITPYRLP